MKSLSRQFPLSSLGGHPCGEEWQQGRATALGVPQLQPLVWPHPGHGAMYRLRDTPTEVAHTLLVAMRRGSLIAAEEITGHKCETIGQWLCAAAAQAELITNTLVHDLHLTAVEVDAFWSFVKKAHPSWRPIRHAGRGGPALGMYKRGSPHTLRGGLGLWRLGR